jgi:quinohemoprotein ethanol dehydrogenase
MKTLAWAFGLAILFAPAAMAQTHDELVTRIKPATSSVDGTMIKDNTATSKDWPTTGLDYAETRFSKLKQINSDNVKNLGLVWSYSLGSSRGVEATPVVVDGICTRPRLGVSCTPSTCAPETRSGPSILV